jgi:hypothetical protein
MVQLMVMMLMLMKLRKLKWGKTVSVFLVQLDPVACLFPTVFASVFCEVLLVMLMMMMVMVKPPPPSVCPRPFHVLYPFPLASL